MSDADSDMERVNRSVRPWVIGLGCVVAVGYGGSILTRGSGWSLVFGLLMVAAGLTGLALSAWTLIKHRWTPR